MRLLSLFFAWSLAAGSLLISGACSSTLNTVKTFEDPDYVDASFKNILVIGVAGSYDNRARWERLMASGIVAQGASASPYYSVVGREQEINRSTVTNVVRANQFDAVLLTRIQSQESDVSVKRGASTAKVSRKDDGPIDLFRYDYEIFNNPDTINVETTVVLSTELFAAIDEKRIWAIESTLSDKGNVTYLIDDAVDMIVQALGRDRLLGR